MDNCSVPGEVREKHAIFSTTPDNNGIGGQRTLNRNRGSMVEVAVQYDVKCWHEPQFSLLWAEAAFEKSYLTNYEISFHLSLISLN